MVLDLQNLLFKPFCYSMPIAFLNRLHILSVKLGNLS